MVSSATKSALFITTNFFQYYKSFLDYLEYMTLFKLVPATKKGPLKSSFHNKTKTDTHQHQWEFGHKSINFPVSVWADTETQQCLGAARQES